MKKFELRWAQLDLARQMETMDFIKETLSLFSRAGYNGVLLYLEDRIATASYDLPAPNECYTEEEIKELVKYAESIHMELVPCVATLGHAERFLRHKELLKFSELQGDMKGRLGGDFKQAFCISHPEFYDFIGTYLTEVAALFPSGYFHIGLDEFWDYNLCPACRKRMPDLASEQKCFLEHICRIREILAGAGKQVMMWSDMFEIYADIFKDVPPDVIMVDWQYQQEVRDYKGHLLDVAAEDRIKVNHKFGHKTIAAPADMVLQNSQSYFDYASGREGVIGGLLTSWEKSDTFLYRSFPLFLAGGFQMSGMEKDEAFAAGMKLLTGSDDPVLYAAVKTALNAGWFRHYGGLGASQFLCRDYYGSDPLEGSACEMVLLVLRGYQGKFPTVTANRFLEDMINAMEEKCISIKGRNIAWGILDKGADQKKLAAFADFRKEYSRHLDLMENTIWNEYRKGITPNVFTEDRKGVEERLLVMEKELSSNSWIGISFCLPDYYGIETLEVEYKMDGQWLKGGKGVFKTASCSALFTRYLLIDPPAKGKIEALRLTASGFGGLGLTFAECNIDGVRYVPSAVLETAGKVQDPTHLLGNDTRFAWFGGQSTRNDYFDFHAAAQKHSLLLQMKEFVCEDLDYVTKA